MSALPASAPRTFSLSQVRASLPRHLNHPKFLLLPPHLPQAQDKRWIINQPGLTRLILLLKGCTSIQSHRMLSTSAATTYPPRLPPMACLAALATKASLRSALPQPAQDRRDNKSTTILARTSMKLNSTYSELSLL